MWGEGGRERSKNQKRPLRQTVQSLNAERERKRERENTNSILHTTGKVAENRHNAEPRGWPAPGAAGAVPGDRGRSPPRFRCRRFRYVSPPEASGEGRRAAAASVGAPVVAVVGGLVGLGFLGDGAALAALSGAALVLLLALAAQYHLQIWKLAVLLQMVVEDLRVGLLMRGEDVHERRRWVRGGCRGVERATAA